MSNNIYLTTDDKLEILKLYKQGMKCQDIGDKFGVSKVRVSQIAKEFGLGRQQKVLTYSKEEVAVMYDMYINGCKAKDIAQQYNINRASIYNLFAKYGFALDDDRHRWYSVNDSYFDVIDDGNKAYFLGFLWADGHNNAKKGIVEMRLQVRDKHILEDISVEIGNQRPLYFVAENGNNKQDTYRMCITSRQISTMLAQYGMQENKTYILQWPIGLDDTMISHFLRGFTDGDGYIGNRELSWAGTVMMLKKIQQLLLDKFNIQAKLYDTKTDIIKSLRVNKKQDIITILNWIYQDADLKLHRKFLKYQEIISS
jgi:transposase-like protein